MSAVLSYQETCVHLSRKNAEKICVRLCCFYYDNAPWPLFASVASNCMSKDIFFGCRFHVPSLRDSLDRQIFECDENVI